MLVIGCSGSHNLAKEIAKRLNANYADLVVDKFPDNEIRIRFSKSVKGGKVILVQSFYNNRYSVNDKIVEVLFAAYTARELKAKKLFLVAPYLAYLREDKRFEKGESISAKIIAKLFKIFDKVFIVEPHLHRFKKLKDFFPNAKKISVAREISDYIKKNFEDYILVGPDQESWQWVKDIAKYLPKPSVVVFKKERIGPEKVRILKRKRKQKKKQEAIIIDDIISTGGTMLEAAKEAKKFAKKICCLGIHGIFAKNSLSRLKKYKVMSTNSIPSRVSKIDITESIVKELKRG